MTLETRDFGNYHFTPHKVFPSIRAASEGVPTGSLWKYIIVTTKAIPDLLDDSAEIEPLVTPGVDGSRIVLIQNGLGIERPHRTRFPLNPIVSCVTVISAEQTKHGYIRQNRWTRISMGPYTDGKGDHGDREQNTKGQEATQSLAKWFAQGGIKDAEPHTEKELQLIRWHKLTINSAFNPSAVLSGGSGNAEMVSSDETRRHIAGCMDEIFTTAQRVLGTSFPPSLATPDKIITSTARNKGAKPSMLLDWEGGRPMELEVILGNPVRIAREHGYEMPRLQSMYALLKSAQDNRNKAKSKL